MKILYILQSYPQISETYIKVEVETLRKSHDIAIISLAKANFPFENPHPYVNLSSYSEIKEFAQNFQPDIIHTHWISSQIKIIHRLATETNTPFTIRSHSFDTLWKNKPWYKKLAGHSIPAKIRNIIPLINSPLCLGLLAFPYAIPRLRKAGVQTQKLVPASPVFSYDIFHNEEKNGEGVINVGACLPKKRFEDFIHLASLLSNQEFNLYSLGYLTDKIKEVNDQAGNPVNMHLPVQHHEMPSIYKNHQWLVYTADPALATIGWPLVLMEAQASGVGVCMRRLRPDLEEYLGGAAILYDSIEELTDIITKPVPEAMRQQGFENAKKHDINKHITLLTDIWQNV